MICEQCETVAHCTTHGCVPKQPAPTEDKALKLALEALEAVLSDNQPYTHKSKAAITAIKQARSAPVQEPVASAAYDMVDRFLRNNLSSDADYAEYSTALDALYTTPPAAPVPDAITGDDESPEYRTGWNECRETMLHMLTTRPAAPVQKTVWTEAQHERAYRNSPELHKDVKSLAAFKRVAKEIASMYGIKENT